MVEVYQWNPKKVKLSLIQKQSNKKIQRQKTETEKFRLEIRCSF